MEEALRLTRRQCLATLGALAASPWTAVGAQPRTNVVLIVSDDQGSTDLGCYGATDLQTPALDSLAARGLRFTQAYVDAPICMPSRGAILTGRHHIRCMGTGGLQPEETTIAEMLRGAGYRTACFGKWHQGHPEGMRPLEQGFDEFLGFEHGAIDNWSHYYYYGSANRHVLKRGFDEWHEDGTFFPHIVTREALRFVDESGDRPFFLYLPLNQPHYPLQAEQEFVERFAHLPMPRRLYAACVASMDAQIGRVLAHLRRRGLEENTLVLFLSDHGHSTEEQAFGAAGRSAPFTGHKGTLREGGVRVPLLAAGAGLPAGQVREQIVSSLDLLPTIAALTGAALPAAVLDGRDLRGVFAGTAPSPHERLHWVHDRDWAVRQGRWKATGNIRENTIALYDLQTDPAESRNVGGQHRDVLSRLTGRHNEWVRSTMASRPTGGPR